MNTLFTSYVAIMWILLILFSGSMAKFKLIPFPTIKKRRNIILFVLELIALSVPIFYGSGHFIQLFQTKTPQWFPLPFYPTTRIVTSPYIIIIALFLLIAGWVISYQRLLLKFLKAHKKRPWLWKINYLVGGNRNSQNIYFFGDWLQIAAISLIRTSFVSLFLCFVFYLFLVFMFTLSDTKRHNKHVSDESDRIKNEAWGRFIKIVPRIISRSITFSLFIIIPIAIQKRDLPIFFGTTSDATNLVTTLAQVEATVFALVITFLFVLVEFTNSAYSPRLIKSITKQFQFRRMSLSALLSIAVKFWLLANVPLYIGNGSNPRNNLLIDWSLVLTAFSVISYVLFIRYTLNLMQPEFIAKQILAKFDQNWMQSIRKNWAKRNRHQRYILYMDDPMIPFERFLAKTIERGDIYSTKVALLSFNEKISDSMNIDDGGTVDNYLFGQMGNIIDILSNTNSETSLELFCGIVGDLTIPSEKVIKQSDYVLLDTPVGSKTLMYIAEKAISMGMISASRQAIFELDRRCELAIRTLPSYSELWIYNPENQKLPTEESKKLWENDQKVESVMQGYFSAFSTFGQQVAEKGYHNLVFTTTNVLASQSSNILKNIENENYQFRLMISCLSQLEKIIRSVCKSGIKNSVTLSPLSYSVDSIKDENIALLLADYSAKYIELLAIVLPQRKMEKWHPCYSSQKEPKP
jgi:hypothetical protein